MFNTTNRTLGGLVIMVLILLPMGGAAAQGPTGLEEAVDIVEVVVTAARGAGERENSRGWAVQGDRACYVIVPKHGVYSREEGPFDDILVLGARPTGITEMERAATLIRAFDPDLALLQLLEPACPFALPADFKPPDDGRAWIVRLSEQGVGRESREVLPLFDFYTLDEHVARVPAGEAAVPEGWSGSTVCLGSKRVGMVRAVEGEGLRPIFYTQKKIQDEVEDYLTVFGLTPRKPPTIPWSDRVGEVLQEEGCEECPEIVVVPAGTFMRGTPDGEPGRANDEGPPRRVKIGAPFAVGRYEVTRDQFDAFVQATGYSVGPGCSYRDPDYSQSGDHPVVCISWDDAIAYADWLSVTTDHRYRLLSETEWEYVARAGSQLRFGFGDREEELCRYGNGADLSTDLRWRNVRCDDGHAQTARVGSFDANAFMVHDLHGNVWEWTEDCWNDNYAGAPNDGSAWTTGECARRVLRGGSWYDKPEFLRSANRDKIVFSNRLGNVGFRIARTLTP